MKTLAELRSELAAVEAANETEAGMQAAMLTFLDRHVDCLFRTQLVGHFTASAWVLDGDCEHVLLIHHRKLDRWLQPGGHADGSADLAAVARREVWEETGLETQLLRMGIFDLDVHEIPARGLEPAHFHYDVRYLLTPQLGAMLQINEEVNAAKWVPLAEVESYCPDPSILRMAAKTEQFLRDLRKKSCL